MLSKVVGLGSVDSRVLEVNLLSVKVTDKTEQRWRTHHFRRWGKPPCLQVTVASHFFGQPTSKQLKPNPLKNPTNPYLLVAPGIDQETIEDGHFSTRYAVL